MNTTNHYVQDYDNPNVPFTRGMEIPVTSDEKVTIPENQYNEIYKKGFTDGREDTLKYINQVSNIVLKILAICAILLGIIIAGTVSARAQETATISKPETVQQDTIPVTILVRISGKPWAFFHDGWEVRKVSEDPSSRVAMQEPCTIPGCAVYHPFVIRPATKYSHLLYLDSRKRPIRKEWVVYQTFKR